MTSRVPPGPPGRSYRVLAVAWIVVLWLPVLQMVFRFVPEGPAVSENRRKAALPQFQGRSFERRSFEEFETFRKSLERFFSDRFGFRDGLIRVHNLLHVRGLRTSPLATVVIGREGWLYYNAEDGLNLLDYCGLAPFTEKDLDTIEHNLTTTRDELRRRGIAFALLVAPNKHTIYPEHLPERIRALAGRTRLDQLAERLGRRPDILFVDVRKTLEEGKSRRPLYFRADTHWNGYGAHLAVRDLLAGLDRAGIPMVLPREEQLALTTQERAGYDLITMLGLPDQGREEQVFVRNRSAKAGTVRVLPLEEGQVPGRETVTCGSGGEGLRFHLAIDSFGMAVWPLLCEQFASGVTYWRNRVVEADLDQERPDVVILQVVERYLRLDREIFLPREPFQPVDPGPATRK